MVVSIGTDVLLDGNKIVHVQDRDFYVVKPKLVFLM